MQTFLSELEHFQEFGTASLVSEREIDGIVVPIFENEFWTAKQRDGHSLHEISYRACYKPQLPGFFIERFCQANDAVYDPFMGRGTTLVEAQLHGCRAVGNDVNPLSQILCQPRLNPPSLDEIQCRLLEISLDAGFILEDELEVFFHRDTLAELRAWRDYFFQRHREGKFDRIDAWIQMTATNRLTGHSKGFFSVYTLPPNQATSLVAQRKINAKQQQVPEYRDTKALILKKSRTLLREALPENYHREDALLLTGSADRTPEIAEASIRLVVTSPPFLDAVDYVGDNWLRNWFCQVSVVPKSIWQLHKISDWSARMAEVFIELHRVLQPGGLVAFEVGEVRKGSVRLEDEVIRAAHPSGLRPIAVMINSQNFTKTANCWGVDNNTKGTNSNRIVLIEKAK